MLKSVYQQVVKVLFIEDKLKKFNDNKKFNIKKDIKFKSMISYPKSKFNKSKYNKDELVFSQNIFYINHIFEIPKILINYHDYMPNKFEFNNELSRARQVRVAG